MKKYVFSAVVCLLSLITLSVQAINHEGGYIAVNPSANKEMAPDLADISFAVKTTDIKSMQKATEDNKEIADKVLGELKNLITIQNGDYIKTSDFSANPVYSYVNNKKVFDKYEVTNKVIVHTKNIDKIGMMIDKAISLGATNVDNLNFSLSNYDSACDKLIAEATTKAKNRAEIVAKNVSSTLDGVRSLDTSCSTNNYSTPRFYMAKNMLSSIAGTMDAAVENTSTSISNGVIKVNANVNVTFFVKN